MVDNKINVDCFILKVLILISLVNINFKSGIFSFVVLYPMPFDCLSLQLFLYDVYACAWLIILKLFLLKNDSTIIFTRIMCH